MQSEFFFETIPFQMQYLQAVLATNQQYSAGQIWSNTVLQDTLVLSLEQNIQYLAYISYLSDTENKKQIKQIKQAQIDLMHYEVVACSVWQILYQNNSTLEVDLELLYLQVAQTQQKQGFAYQHMSFIFSKLALNHRLNCVLEVRCSNLAALKLYQKLGFINVGCRKNYYQNPVEDAMLMRYEKNKISS